MATTGPLCRRTKTYAKAAAQAKPFVVRQAWRVCALGHELIGGGQPISDLEVEVLYGPW
jgi:hypothetical protein